MPEILPWIPAAVIFNWDSTLMDTELHWKGARDLVLSEYAVTPSNAFAALARGLRPADSGRLLASEVG